MRPACTMVENSQKENLSYTGIDQNFIYIFFVEAMSCTKTIILQASHPGNILCYHKSIDPCIPVHKTSYILVPGTCRTKKLSNIYFQPRRCIKNRYQKGMVSTAITADY
jgi:hypothetical protein